MFLTAAAASRRLADDERGTMTSSFLVAASLTALLALMFVVGSYVVRSMVLSGEDDRSVTRIAAEVCTQVYAAAQDPTTATAVQSYAGGTETVSVAEPIGTPMPVTVTLSPTTSAGLVQIEVLANGIDTPGSCPVPSPKPANGTVTTIQ